MKLVPLPVMKIRLVICLALILGGNSCTARANDLASTKNESLDSVLSADFGVKRFRDLPPLEWAFKIRTLSLAERNRIALAAANELSLLTTNGVRLTAQICDELNRKSPKEDTPEESALRELWTRDETGVELLQYMENDDVIQRPAITDPRVIGPLIDMLDFPSRQTLIRDGALQALCGLTKRGYPPNAEFSEYVDGENNPGREPYIKWWHHWWTKNKNRHPVFDPDLKRAIADRMTAIDNQIYLEVKGYGGVAYGGSIYGGWVTPSRRDDIMDMYIDTTMMENYIPGLKSHFYLLISANFETPGFQFQKVQSSNYPPGIVGEWKPYISDKSFKIEEVYREELPGTDIAITVDAASMDGLFPNLVRECLRKPPESIQPEIARLTAQLDDPQHSPRAAGSLTRVGVFRPVIALLSNTNITIMRGAITALAFHPMPSETNEIESAVIPLIHLLKSADPYTQYLAAFALGNIHLDPDITVPALIAASDNTNEQAATAALCFLREFKPQEKVIVPVLIKKLSDPKGVVRGQAAETLHEMSPYEDPGLARSIVSALMKTLDDRDTNVCLEAVLALDNEGNASKAAVPALLALAKSNPALRGQIHATLEHIDSEAARKESQINSP